LGGGMVSGDHTRMDVLLNPGSRCFCGTQASTKIFRSAGGSGAMHTTRASIGHGALLVWAPDVVQAFADAIYHQRQTILLEPGAGIVLVDWLSSGRVARGERWAFWRYHSRTEIFCSGERLLLDSLLLDTRESDGA